MQTTQPKKDKRQDWNAARSTSFESLVVVAVIVLLVLTVFVIVVIVVRVFLVSLFRLLD